jgi:Leucyl aminopeptidase (aminopeptidase T)
MLDPRFDRLAEVLIDFSTRLQKGEKVLIDCFDIPHPMIVSLVRRARVKGGVPLVNLQSNIVNRELLRGAQEDQYRVMAEYELARMAAVDAYIALRGSHNVTEHSDVPSDRMQLALKLLQPVLEQRVNQTKWVVLRWPTAAMAQMASMSTEGFEDFFFRVCTLDYSKMEKAMRPLKDLMDHTDRVRITGPGTDLRFSIQGIPTIPCSGEHNIPDGEIFTCPVKNSVEGHVQFNTPTIYQGTAFDSVRLTFKNGRVIEASGNNPKRINEILDTDEGARHIGEFALGFNPYILEPMRDILFDEKIAGSFHFTPGQAYEKADNGNRSQVHWDLVAIQRPEYGGGEIYFDDRLVRKDGLFVQKDLTGLNPKQLVS